MAGAVEGAVAGRVEVPAGDISLVGVIDSEELSGISLGTVLEPSFPLNVIGTRTDMI